MTIAGLARRGGVGVETIRYYQRRGLLKTPARSGVAGHGPGAKNCPSGDCNESAESAAIQRDCLDEDAVSHLRIVARALVAHESMLAG